MRKLLFCLAIATIAVPGTGQAQVTVDMARVTCANLLAMPPNQTDSFGAWMSGWFNHRWGYITVGMNDYARNIASVRQWCTSNPQQTVMAGLERAHPQPGPVTGQIKVDMSLITCRQYLSSDAERRDFIASWMSGYFSASRERSVFDFQRFANNKAAVDRYCRKVGGETVMSAIQKTVR